MSDALEHFPFGRVVEERRSAKSVEPMRRYIRPSYYADRDAAKHCLAVVAAPFMLLGVLLFFYFADGGANPPRAPAAASGSTAAQPQTP